LYKFYRFIKLKNGDAFDLYSGDARFEFQTGQVVRQVCTNSERLVAQ